MEPISAQTILQKKISLATSENAPIILELMKDCIPQSPLVGDTEYKTLVNAITFDVQSTMIKNMVELLENLRQGKGYEIK